MSNPNNQDTIKFFICLCGDTVCQEDDRRMTCDNCQRGYTNSKDEKGKHFAYMIYHEDEAIYDKEEGTHIEVRELPLSEFTVKFSI